MFLRSNRLWDTFWEGEWFMENCCVWNVKSKFLKDEWKICGGCRANRGKCISPACAIDYLMPTIKFIIEMKWSCKLLEQLRGEWSVVGPLNGDFAVRSSQNFLCWWWLAMPEFGRSSQQKNWTLRLPRCHDWHHHGTRIHHRILNSGMIGRSVWKRLRRVGRG